MKLMFDAVFVLALVSTLSTAAFVVVAVYFVGRRLFLSSRRITGSAVVVAGLLLVCSVVLFLYAPVFGYLEKSITHSDSFTDRISWYSSESSLRVETAALQIVYFLFVIPFLSHEKWIVLPILFFVSAINVLAFTPFAFISVSVLLALRLAGREAATSVISLRRNGPDSINNSLLVR